jgi:peptidoglycan/LPS O-acetylase OafA/YrhL
VAILVVLLFHWELPFAKGGFIGVDLFFVLSGFLITTLLLRELAANGRIDLRNFYARRALRLLPALLVMCGFFASWLLLVSQPAAARHGVKVLLAVLFYYSNWLLALSAGDTSVLAPMNHMWSLSIEEQFYLVWPVTLAWLAWRRFSPGGIAKFLAGAIGIATLWRVYLALSGTWFIRIYAGTDTRIDSILVGCLLAVLVYYGLHRPRRHQGDWLAWASMGLFAILVYAGRQEARWTYVYGCSITALVCASLVSSTLTTGTSRFGRVLAWQPLQWLGRISYGVYLWHLPIIEMARRAGFMPMSGPPNAAQLLGMLSTTLAVAAISFHVVELPFLRLRNRFGPRPVPALPPTR